MSNIICPMLPIIMFHGSMVDSKYLYHRRRHSLVQLLAGQVTEGVGGNRQSFSAHPPVSNCDTVENSTRFVLWGYQNPKAAEVTAISITYPTGARRWALDSLSSWSWSSG